MIEAVAPNQILPLLQCYVAMPLLVLWARRTAWLNHLRKEGGGYRVLRMGVHALMVSWTLLALLIFAGFHLSRVSGQSMEPTFVDKEWVVSSANAYAWHWPFWGSQATRSRIPQKGDVITFYHDDPNTHAPTLLIKRVLGLPGDVIRQYPGGLSINGVALRPRPAAPDVWWVDGHAVKFASLKRAFRSENTWTVGPDEVFVMGDHWDASWDSRFWGPLPISQIATQVLSQGRWP